MTDRLRFDFSNNGPVEIEKLAAVEAICIEHIERALDVYDLEVPLSKAQEITGLRAVFGEVC